MSTIEDFRNAPVGATATHPVSGSRAMKIDDGEQHWITPWGSGLSDVEMGLCDYTLDTPAPTTAREALDIAWDLAHEVKEGQVIPEGTRYLEVTHSGLRERTAVIDHTISPRLAHLRTLDPLPVPEPDWLNAPAVLATCGCRGIELWHPNESKDGLWVSSDRGEYALWSTLRDVTPLYPKGQEA